MMYVRLVLALVSFHVMMRNFRLSRCCRAHYIHFCAVDRPLTLHLYVISRYAGNACNEKKTQPYFASVFLSPFTKWKIGRRKKRNAQTHTHMPLVRLMWF